MTRGRRGFFPQLAEYSRNFLTNLDQPGMPWRIRIAKLVRNRIRATFSSERCCGHPGEPGC
ncbi:MAG: hypothetical protein ACRDJ4_11750 [Actinomycetota bacterium]